MFREQTLAFGTHNVRFPDQVQLNQIVAKLQGRKRAWVWEHGDKQIATTENENELQVSIDKITAAHDGAFRLYHLPLPNIPEDAAQEKTLAFELNLKITDVYNFLFDDAADHAPLRINMPSSMPGAVDFKWIYQGVPSFHQETESFLYLKNMFSDEGGSPDPSLSNEIKWILYGLKKEGDRYVWKDGGGGAKKYLDSDGLPPKEEWLMNKVTKWSEVDDAFKDEPMLLFELKTIMIPHAFQTLQDRGGHLILDQPRSGLYLLLTRQPGTPWTVQMSQEIQVVDRHQKAELSKHVIDHGSFSVVQFTEEGDKLTPKNVALFAPSGRDVYWHLVRADWPRENVIEWISSQKGWNLGDPVQKGPAFKMTNEERAKKEGGLLVCAFEYVNASPVWKSGANTVPTMVEKVALQSLDDALKRTDAKEEGSFQLVVPGVPIQKEPEAQGVYLRRLITTVYMPPVCPFPILAVEPLRIPTPDAVKEDEIPPDTDRTQLFRVIRAQLAEEERLDRCPSGTRSTPITVAIKRIINNRKNAAAFMKTIPKDAMIETMSRNDLLILFGLQAMKGDSDAYWRDAEKKEWIPIHPGRMEAIKLFDMDPRKALTRDGAIWLRNAPQLAQLGVDQFLKNTSYERLLYRALQMTVEQNALLARQKAERMIKVGSLSSRPYHTTLIQDRNSPSAQVMLRRLESLNRLYGMLYGQDTWDRLTKMTIAEIDNEYVKPLLERPEKEHVEFARQFWELPLRLFPNHITCWDTDVSFESKDGIKSRLAGLQDLAPQMVAFESEKMPDARENPEFLRLFWISMFLESTEGERKNIKSSRNTLLDGVRYGNSDTFTNKFNASRATTLPALTKEEFAKKYMFEGQTQTARSLFKWPNVTMPLFESDNRELLKALMYRVITPDHVKQYRPDAKQVLDLYEQLSNFIDDGRIFANSAIKKHGFGLAEHLREQAWAGYRSLALRAIKRFWSPDAERVDIVECYSSIPTIARIEEAMIVLGVKKEGQREKRSLQIVDENMLMLLDQDWDDLIYQDKKTNTLYQLVCVQDRIKALEKELRIALDVRKDSVPAYKDKVSAIENLISVAVEPFNKKVEELINEFKAGYSLFLTEQVNQDLKMNTLRRLGIILGNMVTPGQAADQLAKQGRQIQLQTSAVLKQFNEGTLAAIKWNGEFEKVWQRLHDYLGLLLKDLPVREKEQQTAFKGKKEGERTLYIYMDEAKRKTYEETQKALLKQTIDDAVQRELAKKKQEEDKKKKMRLREDWEKEEDQLVGAPIGGVAQHPVERLVKGDFITSRIIFPRLKDFYDYVKAKIIHLAEFEEAFKVFDNVDSAGFDDAYAKFIDSDGKPTEALYLIASDSRYNERLSQIDGGSAKLTLGHVIFHRFVHIVNGLFIAVEQNYGVISRAGAGKLDKIKDQLEDLINAATRSDRTIEGKLKDDSSGTLKAMINLFDRYAKRQIIDDQSVLDWFGSEPASQTAEEMFSSVFSKATLGMYAMYYKPYYDILVEWLKQNGTMQKDSFMRRADITPMQSRFFRPNANEPSGLSAALNTFLGMDPDKSRDQTSLSRMVWAPRRESLQEQEEQKKEKKKYEFLRPLCGRKDEEDEAAKSEMTEDMLCPRKMLDLANAGLLWAVDHFYAKGPQTVDQIPRGSFFNLMSRILDSHEFLNMRMRFGMDPSLADQHAYSYKLGGFATEEEKNPFVTAVSIRDLPKTQGHIDIDEEFARETLNAIETAQKGAIKPLIDMTTRYNMPKDGAHELWRLALFGRTTSPHVVWTSESMMLKDAYLLMDFLVELDKHVTAAIKKDPALASFQPLPLLQSVWAFLKFYIMPKNMYNTVFLQQLHQNGQIIYDYFSPYVMTQLLRNQFTYNLKEISPEPITFQWFAKFRHLENPFQSKEETIQGVIEKVNGQMEIRKELAGVLENFVFYYSDPVDPKNLGEPYQRIIGQWDRSHNPFDPSTDLITGSGFCYTRDARWIIADEKKPWITVSPFAGLDTRPEPPEFPHGRDASYNADTTMFDTDEEAAIYEWRAGKRLFMRPNVFHSNFLDKKLANFFDWRLGTTGELIQGEISLLAQRKDLHLWPVLVAENHSLVRWFNEWANKLDSHPSLVGFHRLFSQDPWRPASQDPVGEAALLSERKKQLEKNIKARIEKLRQKTQSVLDEFHKKTQVITGLSAGAILGDTLDKWKSFKLSTQKEFDEIEDDDTLSEKQKAEARNQLILDEKEVAELTNTLARAEAGLVDFTARMKEWAIVIAKTFEQNEWIKSDPDTRLSTEDPNILNWYQEQYSTSSPFPEY